MSNHPNDQWINSPSIKNIYSIVFDFDKMQAENRRFRSFTKLFECVKEHVYRSIQQDQKLISTL